MRTVHDASRFLAKIQVLASPTTPTTSISAGPLRPGRFAGHRIGSAKEIPGGRFIDDRGPRCAGRVLRREITAAVNRHSDGLEIPGRDVVDVDRRVDGGRQGLSSGVHRRIQEARAGGHHAAQRAVAGQTCRAHGGCARRRVSNWSYRIRARSSEYPLWTGSSAASRTCSCWNPVSTDRML